MKGWIFLISVLCFQQLNGQSRSLKGTIKDSHSDEPIPFASIVFRNSTVGVLSDANGSFELDLDAWPGDTLMATNVGFEDALIKIDTALFEINVTIELERGKKSGEVIIRSKVGRGIILWRKIVRNKDNNDRTKFDNFSYELYNKLEADLNKVNKEKVGRLPVIRSFKFILDRVDTVSEANPILPLYLTETISDYYFQKSPRRTREVIKAVKTIGFQNESVSKLLGGMYQNVNVYKNFIPVFDKEFVSPISDNGDAYYNYRVPDTQYIDGRRYFHFLFNPKRKGSNTFLGDAWIADSSFAVMKMNLRIPPDANINFVERLSLVQEYQLVRDSIWFLSKDKFVVDFNTPLGKRFLNIIGRKTTTYREIVLNDSSVSRALDRNKVKEEVVMTDSSRKMNDEYWQQARHEELTSSEQGIYQMIDTLVNMPRFKRIAKWANFIGTGYKSVGNYQIGPWFNWISGNQYEGARVRFDIGTNSEFSKKIYLSTYLAYGFRDQKMKGRVEALYMLNKSPRSTVYASYQNDIDNGQVYYDEVGTDNVFGLAIRKPGVLFRFIKVQQARLEYYKEWVNGLSVTLTANRRNFTPVYNLPPAELFPSEGKGDLLTSFEGGIRLRFAYLERFLENTFFRVSLGSDYPITEIRYSHGFSGVFKGNYDFDRLSVSVSDYQKIAPLGTLYYNAYAGRVFGTLPYMMLEVAPGNNIWYYNKYAFNLMTRYEYIGDRYAGINIEHNIGNGLFRFLPPTRLLKFRQFWSAKVLWSDMSKANKEYNSISTNGATPFKTLDGKLYMELGTGVDNILKIFRVDFIWRLLPRPLPVTKAERFGVFFSFRLAL